MLKKINERIFNAKSTSTKVEMEIKDIENEDEVFNEKINKQALLNECLDYFITNKAKEFNLVQRGIKSKKTLLADVERFLYVKKITEEEKEYILDMFQKYIWGYYVLDDLVHDETISDIKIINKDNVRIKRLGKRSTSDVKFTSDDELNRFIRIVAIKNRINISDINAIQTFTDKTTNKDFILRINIMTEYITSVGHPYLHIRKIPKKKYTSEKLIQLGLASSEQMEYLIEAVKQGKSIFFTGKGASGKTTILNALIDEIPHDKSGLIIQENEELFSETHPDLMFQKVKIAKGEGKIEYNLKDLSINGLLIDLDVFVIGEIKGAEAMYFLNACYTGHICMGAGHGNNSIEAINKLVDYMKYESDYSREDLLKMVGKLDIVVFMKDFKCNEISEIVGFDYGKKELIYNTIYKNGIKTNESQKI